MQEQLRVVSDTQSKVLDLLISDLTRLNNDMVSQVSRIGGDKSYSEHRRIVAEARSAAISIMTLRHHQLIRCLSGGSVDIETSSLHSNVGPLFDGIRVRFILVVDRGDGKGKRSNETQIQPTTHFLWSSGGDWRVLPRAETEGKDFGTEKNSIRIFHQLKRTSVYSLYFICDGIDTSTFGGFGEKLFSSQELETIY